MRLLRDVMMKYWWGRGKWQHAAADVEREREREAAAIGKLVYGIIRAGHNYMYLSKTIGLTIMHVS